MKLAIVIVNWNGRDLLARCLRSIEATAGDLPHAVWVVDNGSTDGAVEMVARDFPAVHLIASERNLGFAGGNNLALREVLNSQFRGQNSEGFGTSALSPLQSALDYVLLLNPDTVVQPGALQALVRFMDERPHVGAAGALLLNEDGSFQASYVPFPTLRQEFLILSGLGRKHRGPAYPSAPLTASLRSRDDVDYVVGACIIARASAVCEVGLLDEGFFMYSEEVDWCYRFRAAGWAVGYVAEARIVHLGGGSTRQVRPQMLAELYRSRVRFFRKHYGPLAALGLRALLLAMNGAKLLRRAVHPSPGGTPPLPWPLLRHAIGAPHTVKN
jgi:GT2 family glycosyltransferase